MLQRVSCSRWLGWNVYTPASFSILLFVQYFTILANGRTRSSAWTYVLIILVFSSARGLLTLVSHASCSVGSQNLTMGTFADARQMTSCIPSVGRISARLQQEWVSQRTSIKQGGKTVHRFQCLEGSRDTNIHCVAWSASLLRSPAHSYRPSESLELRRFPDEPKTLTLMS